MALKIIKRTVALDGNSVTEALPSSYFDGETAAHQFVIRATRGGQAVSLSGTVAGVFLNANDETVPVTGGSIVDGAAVLTLSDACYHVNGRFTLSINVDGQTVYCCRSSITRRSSETTYDPSGVLPSISELLDAIGDMETATAAAEAAATKSVRYDTEQTLTDAQKSQARQNIGAVAVSVSSHKLVIS